MALQTLTGGYTSFRTRRHGDLTEADIFAEVEKGDRVAMGSTAEGLDRDVLAHYGRKWMESVSRIVKYREPDGSEVSQEHCELLGYKWMLLDRSNSPPAPVVRVWSEPDSAPKDIRVDTLPDDEEGLKLKKQHKDAVARFNQTGFNYMHWFATTGSPEERGLGLDWVDMKSVPVVEDEPLTSERDRVFAKVQGKHLREETQRPAPEGMEWQLVRKKAKAKRASIFEGI